MISDWYSTKSDLQKQWIDKVVETFLKMYSQEDLDFLSENILPNVSIGSSTQNTDCHSLTKAYDTFENYIAAYLTAYAGTDTVIKRFSNSSADYENAAKCLYTLQILPHAIQELYNMLGKNIFNANGTNKYILIPDGNGKKPVNCAVCYFGFLNASINFWKTEKGSGWNYINLKIDFTGNKNYNGFNVFNNKSFSADPSKNIFKLTFTNYALSSPKRKTVLANLDSLTKANLEDIISSIGD